MKRILIFDKVRKKNYNNDNNNNNKVINVNK